MTDDQLPRERLFEKGPSALSDVELLAILLRTGGAGRSVLSLSESLLDGFGGLGGLLRTSVREFLSFKGIGAAKAATVSAAVELGRRLAMVETDRPKGATKVSPLRRELEKVRALLAHEEREFIVALFVEQDGGVLAVERLSFGGVDGAVLDLKFFLRVAIRLDADGLVLVHNHPDGGLESSLEDRRLTAVVRGQVEALGIRFYGHYIVSRRGITAVEG